MERQQKGERQHQKKQDLTGFSPTRHINILEYCRGWGGEGTASSSRYIGHSDRGEKEMAAASSWFSVAS